MEILDIYESAPALEQPLPLVVRVAIFPSDQGQLEKYGDFVRGQLFPALRSVPGYVATLIGRGGRTDQAISLSLWRSESSAVAGEQAVGRTIRALPPGSAPRPSTVDKYVIEYRDFTARLL